jgi:hypothetical protein
MTADLPPAGKPQLGGRHLRPKPQAGTWAGRGAKLGGPTLGLGGLPGSLLRAGTFTDSQHGTWPGKILGGPPCTASGRLELGLPRKGTVCATARMLALSAEHGNTEPR